MSLTPNKTVEIADLLNDTLVLYELTSIEALGIIELLKYNILRDAEEQANENDGLIN